MVEIERWTQPPSHPDPEAPGYAPPDPAARSPLWRAASTSREMAAYRAALMLPGQPTIRAAILDDLGTRYDLPPDACVERARHWEEWSAREWQDRPRDTREAIADFYNTVQSWSFDLAWYAYLQAEQAVYPTSVVAARVVLDRLRGQTADRVNGTDRLRCLDFGSGAGDLAQLLLALGHGADLADASRPLLEFAQWRLARRGQHPTCIDLNTTALPPRAYDVIFAKDVLVHVPDFAEAVTSLHTALRPGGLLLATFDTRPPSPENAWHLYADDVPLRRTVQDLGFEQEDRLDRFLFIYRRVEPAGLPHLVRRARNAVLLSPARHLLRDGKARARRLLGR
jgi:2-polyprenyl-3-methyl-5-hydroxy-6-metoxy-1,4-benzoquinol methylase